ncbi:MAG TPA: heparan-alpha-glucosaminide N-acetyltransferase domain-containing protein, partial [Thermoanaerobaculia bacterium]|nr:heparan-alpha-glucosaminide N-acetyltransferase domain-containing protein [Thermoanaerobaculia bacterium]
PLCSGMRYSSRVTVAPTPALPRERLVSLDVFRGITIASMLLVNNPGTWSAIFWPLGHAAWHGWTPTDLIFPFFLFIVGVTTDLSLRGRPQGDAVRRIIKRGLLIVLFGLLLNAFPFYSRGELAGIANPTIVDRVAWRVDHLRIPGVLQRIGVVYMIAALISLKTTRKQQIAIIVAILLGYWAILTRGPLEPPEATIAAASDRAIFGEKHLWSQSKTWDPEGPLSTIPAVATGLLGIVVAPWVRDRRVRELALAGVAGLVAGLLWDFAFPINKALWTSSYVVFSAGFACVMLALCIWIIDIKGMRGWTKPFVVYGVNPLTAFIGSGIMAKLLDMWRLKSLSYRVLYEPYFPPKVASLLWGLTFVLFWLGVLWILYRRKWFLRV